MKISEITIDSSDTTVRKNKEYLEKFEFRSWHTGEPKRICGYGILKKGYTKINFRNKEEVKKFAEWLTKISKKLKSSRGRDTV